jgi:hypothetical protein
LAGSVLILVVCLPLLRPLRQPDSRRWGEEEQMIASTVQSIVEQRSLAIDQSIFGKSPVAIEYAGRHFSPYPPMYSVLLAPAYWGLLRYGLDYSDNIIFVQYVLTLVGAALPTALCVGLIYRLGRMFELRRPLRVLLGLVAVVGGGLIAYGVALNRHAPAAMLILIALSCVSHLAVTSHPHRDLWYALIGGCAAALAGTLDPPMLVAGTLFAIVMLAMRWSIAMRVSALLLYLIGGAPVVMLNLALLHNAGMPITRMFWAQEPMVNVPVATPAEKPAFTLPEAEEDSEMQPSLVRVAWKHVANWLGRVIDGLIGEHGILSHFPICILGVIGAIWVLHRNWTSMTKCMAGITLISSLIVLLAYSLAPPPKSLTFGAPWFAATAPMLLIWVGAWMRHNHRVQSWSAAGILLAFSMLVALIGMSDPSPRGGYKGYSFAEAAMDFVRSKSGPSSSSQPPRTP